MTRSVTNIDFLNDIGTVNAQTGTTYTVASGDRGKLITFSNASAVAVTQPQAGSTFPNGWFVDFQNRGAGTVTITPTTSTVDGAASIALTTDQGCRLYSDGTNYFTQRGVSSAALTVKDEGSTLTSSASSLDFVGSGVTATNTGSAVTITVPGTTVLRGWISGLVLANNATDASNDIDISIGEAADSTATYLMSLGSPMTKQLDAAWAVGTNAGGLDTGTEANSTWYHVYLIRKDSDGSTDVLFSTSASAPTMPSGYTAKRLIGSFFNNSSGNIDAFTAHEVTGGGIFTEWKSASIDVNLSSTLGTTARLDTIKVPTGYKTLASLSAVLTNASTVFGHMSDPDTNDQAPSSTVAPLYNILAGATATQKWMRIPTNTSAQVRARATATVTTYQIVTYGWEWGRR